MRGRRDEGVREEPGEIAVMSYKEIAAKVGLSPARVMQLCQRALKKLRVEVENDPALREVVAEMFGDVRSPS